MKEKSWEYPVLQQMQQHQGSQMPKKEERSKSPEETKTPVADT